MKLSRRLIPAFAMLLVSAVLMSTASFAWFSMRDEVTASGMTVSAESNSIYLEIKGAGDAGYSATGNANINEKLFPVAHNDWDSKADIETLSTWYYKFSDAADEYEASQGGDTYTIDAFDNYVFKTTYEVKLHTGSAEKAYDLYVSSVTIPENTGITVVIAGANGYVELDETDADISFAETTVLSNEVTATKQDITVYIYINGENQNVYSDNIATLTGAVSFELKVFESADH